MARFILDINISEVDSFMNDIMDFLAPHTANITCIDETNENQFYIEGEGDNSLTQYQIDRYNIDCNNR